MDTTTTPANQAGTTEAEKTISQTIWTADFDTSNPDTFEDDVVSLASMYVDDIRSTPRGTIVVRDFPAKGPDLVPIGLRSTLGSYADRCFVAPAEDPKLPGFEQRIADDLFAEQQARKYSSPEVRVIVITKRSQCAQWAALFQHYNPEAWIFDLSRGDGRNACLVQEGQP